MKKNTGVSRRFNGIMQERPASMSFPGSHPALVVQVAGSLRPLDPGIGISQGGR